MKRIYHLLISLLLLGVGNSAFADYPIVKYRFLADPGAFVYNGRVYVYCSNDDENGDDGYDMSSIVCVSSSDLKNWTDHGIVFDVPRDASWSGLSWAPSPAYKNGKFYLYFGNGGSAIGVAVSDSPTGPFKDPVGRNIASGSTPGVQPFDGWLFDPMTFVDDDGQAYMYFGGNGEGNLRVVKLNNDMISVNGSAGKFNVPNFFEAAWVHKHNGTYYFSYSTNPSAGMRIDYMTSNNPMSGFTYRGVLSPQPPNNNNNNHQAIVKLNNQWYQIYHNRLVASQVGVGATYHRNLAIDAFSHRTDGTIVQMVNTTNGVTQVGRLNPYVRTEAETMSDLNGIETEVCSAGGMNLYMLDNNDWTMVEGVDFGSSGASSIAMRVASTKTGGTIEIRTGSSTGTLIGTVTVPNTGGNQTWQTVNANVTKTTGVQNVYFVFKGSGSSLFNVDYWTFATSGPQVSITAPLSTATIFVGDPITISATATMVGTGSISNVKFYDGTTLLNTDNATPYSFVWTGATQGNHTIKAVATDNSGNTSEATLVVNVKVPQAPYSGTPHTIPGVIQAEHYDVGGQDLAYNEANTNGNQGGATLRNDEVDIETTTDVGGGHNIGYALNGEWLEYTVNVTSAGMYSLDLRMAADGTGKTLHVEMDGVNITGAITVPSTGGWQTWQTVTVNNLNLTAGQKIMRIAFDSDYMNLNFVEFKKNLPTGLEDENVAMSTIFPNPFSANGLHIHKSGSFHYKITDMSGVILEQGQNKELVGTQLSSGVYFLSLENEGTVTTHKIVRQ
jgi:arabinoxylan arabinofuranohydrolase